MKILALDVASKTGFCAGTTERNFISGVWDLSIKRDESSGMRLIRFKRKLVEMIEVEKPDVVVFERSAGRFMSAVIKQAELHGVLELYLEENKINYRAYSASEIKKYATGKGNANKDILQQVFEQQTGYSIKQKLDMTEKQWNPSSDIIDSYFICKYGHQEQNEE